MARPVQFDKARVIQLAMKVFWKHGYDSINLPTLMEKMGLSRSSLYNVFGDKRTLFYECMLHYIDQIGKKRVEILKKATSVREGLEKYFDHQMKIALGDKNPAGCFFTNTATSLEMIRDKNLAQLIAQSSHILEKAFYDLLKRGQKSGEVAKNKNIKALSGMLLSHAYGLNVMANIKPDKKFFKNIIKSTLSTVL